MKTLYIIHKSPYQRNDALLPLRHADSDDAVLLISNGVVMCSSVPKEISGKLASAEERGVKFFGLKEDLEARGLTSKFPTVDYKGAVELIFKYERTV